MKPQFLESPDAGRARYQKRELAMNILDDIGQLVDAISPRAMPVVVPLLRTLAEHASTLSVADLDTAVGPELYRWLGMAGDAIRARDETSIGCAVNRLPALLLGRLITSGVACGTFWLPVFNNVIRIPQAGLAIATAEAPLCTVSLNQCGAVVNGAQVERGRLLSHIDGRWQTRHLLPNSMIFFNQRGDCVAEMIEDLSVTASRPVKHDEGLTLIDPERFDAPEVARIIANMADGLALIRRHAPEHAQEVEAPLDAITLVTGQRFVGGSDIYYHGVAVLNPDVDWSPTTYADHLVHEGAHIVLHARNELTPLLLNGGAMGAKSPIREDPRPLYGILHSTFVFMRLVQFFQLAATPIGSDEAMFRLHRHLLGFYAGMAELERFARFTVAGSDLFHGMHEVMTRFRNELPEPDPQFYKRVGKDYVV